MTCCHGNSQVDRVIRNDSSRQVVAYHRSSPRLDITLTFNEQSDVTFLYDESYLEDFQGAIFLDKYSSRYLNITLIGGSGSIIGSIKVSHSRYPQKQWWLELSADLQNFADLPISQCGCTFAMPPFSLFCGRRVKYEA